MQARAWCDGPHEGVPRRATLSAPKGEWPYTEATPSGAAPTSPPEGVFRHKRRMELDELLVPLDRQTYSAGYTHMEIEAPCPGRAGSNDPDLRCRGIGRGLLKSATPLD